MAAEDFTDFAVFFFVGQVGDELVEAATARNVEKLTAQTDAQCREAAFFNFGEQCEFEVLAVGIDVTGIGMPGLAVERGVEVIATGEEDAFEQVEVLGDQGRVGAVGDGEWQSPGFFDGGGVGESEVVGGLAVDGVGGDSDEGAFVQCNAFLDEWRIAV